MKNRITRAQIAAKIPVTLRYFRESIESRPDFPAPDLVFSQKTVLWDETKIDLWLQVEQRKTRKAA